MKKIISYFAITVLLFACSKEESPAPSDQGNNLESSLKAGNSSPVVTTNPATSILSFTAVSGGSVSKSGGGNNVTERGVCFNTSSNPTIADPKVPSGSGPGNFTCILSGLSGSTTYYARAYATKNEGTTYGNEISFTTAAANCEIYGTVTDYDGNVYTAITVGTQVWMLENLKTTHYRDGTPIPNVTAGWFTITTGAYCNYNNDESYVATYGRLYNWYAVGDPHNLAPAGWHVASREEFTTLLNYFGGGLVAGGGLKEAGTEHWLSPNLAYNSCGFTALPGGYRSGVYAGIGERGSFWTSFEFPSSPDVAGYIRLSNNSESVFGNISGTMGDGGGWGDKNYGYSVRCVKD